MVTMKGLPMTYNRDMQEDKVPLFEAADEVSTSLEMARTVIETVKLNPAKPAAALGRRGATSPIVARRLCVRLWKPASRLRSARRRLVRVATA